MFKKQDKLILMTAGLLVSILLIIFFIFNKGDKNKFFLNPKGFGKELSPTPIKTLESVVSTTPTATPTAKPISFEEMNKNFGPCGRVSVLMYHHIQEMETAKKRGQTNLTVSPEYFRKQMQYLKDKNYNVIGMNDLKNFLDNGVNLPAKAVLLTMDDGYKDNYEKMYPILKEFGYRATVFVATGLINNFDYLSWSDMENMKDLVYFGNHTWSHHNSSGTEEKQNEEIGTADKQLNEHGFNNLKIFAYPYGSPSGIAQEVLKNDGYKIAFTTNHGSILCKGKSLELPRVRIGDALLSNFGL